MRIRALSLPLASAFEDCIYSGSLGQTFTDFGGALAAGAGIEDVAGRQCRPRADPVLGRQGG